MILYKNKNYEVIPSEDGVGYTVVNRVCGNTDAKIDDLPSAILQAVQFNFLLDTNFHEKVEEDIYAGEPNEQVVNSTEGLGHIKFKH